MSEISVIVPVYNTEQYLPKCIESVLHQTFKDFELILVDDGSSDKSGEICDYYMLADKRIQTIHKNNEGVSSARNTGLSHANGKYITFVDSDDYIEETWLSVMYDSIKNNYADLVYANYDRVDVDGNIIYFSSNNNSYRSISYAEEKIQYILDTLKGGLGWEVCFRLFRGDIIKNNGLQFCETCSGFAEDMGFVLSYILYCDSVYSTDSRGYKYLVRNNSTMEKSKKTIRFDSLNEVSKAIHDQFIKSSCRDLENRFFPLIHFGIMYDQYKRLINLGKLKELKKELDKIKDQQYYVLQTKKIFRVYPELKKQVAEKDAQRIILFSSYCLLRNYKIYSYMSGIYYNFFWK